MKNKIYLSSILFFAFFHFQMAVSAVKVACVGNSITAGYLLDSPKTYPSVLQTLMGSDYEVKNFGVSGTTYLVNTGNDWSYWGVNGKIDQVVSYLPNKIIIELGTNDSGIQYNSYRNVLETDIEKMILKFKALASNPEIYLCIPFPALNAEFDIQSSVIENEIIPKIRQAAQNQNVKLIDLNTTFSNHHELYADGIHPNADGARIIAGIVKMNIAPIVKVTGVSLNLSDLSIREGDVKSLTTTVQPATASVKEVFWSSNHPEIARVSASGKIYGVAVGSCTITAQTLDGDFIAACNITVDVKSGEPANTHTFKFVVGGGGGYCIIDKFKYINMEGVEVEVPATNPAITFSNFSLHGNGWLESGTIGATVELTFTGTGIKMYGTTNQWAGHGKGYIDNIEVADISFNDILYLEHILIFENLNLETAVETIQSNDVKIYTNSATNVLHIANASKNAAISIFSIDGKLVSSLKSTGSEMQIDVAGWNKGVYVLSIRSDKKDTATKLVIR